MIMVRDGDCGCVLTASLNTPFVAFPAQVSAVSHASVIRYELYNSIHPSLDRFTFAVTDALEGYLSMSRSVQPDGPVFCCFVRPEWLFTRVNDYVLHESYTCPSRCIFLKKVLDVSAEP